MAKLGISDAFRRYGAKLKNVQWSVSAWAPDGSLVVSLWAHHIRPSAKGTMEFAGSSNRWKGPGNTEFRANVERAFLDASPVRLVVARTTQRERVEAGDDGGTIPKDFDVRDEVTGKVIEWDGENYAFKFEKA